MVDTLERSSVVVLPRTRGRTPQVGCGGVGTHVVGRGPPGARVAAGGARPFEEAIAIHGLA